MGRDKGPRVKGNLKPASSGRSAELAAPAGPLTFGSLSSGNVGNAPFVPLIPELDESGLDPQIALSLRKLGKKDATTKIKALAELGDMCKKDEFVPAAILPYWPKIYVRLAGDESKKVRELDHGLLEVIATSVGRNLAPHTKTLIPTLFLSQSDPYPPAASAARIALNAIFSSEEKQEQAIIFCLAEICLALVERLGGGTELSKITFLDGLNRILRFGQEIQTKTLETLDFALKQQGFWAMGSDESPIIRKTFYDVVSTIAEKAGNRIPKSKLSAALRKGFESEKLEVQSLWNCFLTLAINGVFEEKTTAEAHILLCAKNAFYGHATQLGPLLLPLVSKLGTPPLMFESLEEGFLLEKSVIERKAIVRTYAEILSFAYKDTESVPKSTFPFVTSHLNSMTEFGRTLSALVKKDSFYESLAQYCLEREDVMQNPSLGTFIISFFKDRRCVKFSDGDEKCGVQEDTIVQKKFLHKLAMGILNVQNFVSFEALSRWMSGTPFLAELLNPSDIPNIFDFTNDEQKLIQLRLSLELIKSFPDSPQSLCLLSSVFTSFKEIPEDLELFVREIEPFDKIKELRLWLKSGVFKDEIFLQSKPLSKYMLGRKEIFGEEMVQAKLDVLVASPEDHLDFAADLVYDTSGSTVDMTPFLIAIWDAFLDDKSGENTKLEEISSHIVGRGLVSRNALFERAHQKAGETLGLEDLKRLTLIAQKLTCEEQIDVDDVAVFIDPDLLVFRGFGHSCLKQRDFAPPPDFTVSKVLRQVLFSTEVALAGDEEIEILQHLGMNLLYAAALIDISKDATRHGWVDEMGSVSNEIYAELNAGLSNVLERLAKTSQWKQFSKKVYEKSDDPIWESGSTVIKFLEITKRMELSTPMHSSILHDVHEILSTIDRQSVTDLVYKFKFDSNPPYTKLIDIITAKRNQSPDHFHFDEQFNTLQSADKDKLIGILEIVTGLIGKNVEFASVASCWISAWLKQATDNYDSDKTSYLWVSKLSRAVILLAKFAKLETPFAPEFTEFHSENIFPSIYRHFLQLAGSEEFWAVEAAVNVAEAVSLIPSSILNKLLEEPSKAFELFLPVTLRKEVIFKVASHSLLSKVTLTKEILPREFEAYSKRFRKGGARTEEEKVTFLLLWDALLRAQPNAFELANYVKEDHLLPQVLSLLFFDLLESSVIPSLKTYFDTQPTISCHSLSSVTHLSAWVLQNLLRTLPYTVRWWWASLSNKGNKAHVERITTKFLSAKLAAEELNKVKWDEEGDNVSVNSHPGCNELIARYKIEETSVTLKITLPLNHPLGPVTVSVSDKKLHARISQLLNTRSHSLSAGLRLWKESLDTVYKDADECAICFFILQHQTKQLPKLGCKTCKKKFHAACLYKWFSTSNKSECPLCRNLW